MPRSSKALACTTALIVLYRGPPEISCSLVTPPLHQTSPSPSTISPTYKGIARVGAAAFLVPQLSTLLWWLHTSSAIQFRGWINAEYLLLLSVAVLFPSRGMIALLTAELTVSLIEPIAHLYYFSPADTISSLRYLLLIPAPRLATYIGLLIAYILGCTAMLRFTLGKRRLPNARSMAALLLLGALLPTTLDLLSGRFFLFHADPLFGDSDLDNTSSALRWRP
jgi:hypothetical protein